MTRNLLENPAPRSRRSLPAILLLSSVACAPRPTTSEASDAGPRPGGSSASSPQAGPSSSSSAPSSTSESQPGSSGASCPAGSSCRTPYALGTPSHFPPLVIPGDNPLTAEGVALGRSLYHDPMLGQGGPQEGHACATCHVQAMSFSSPRAGTSVMAHVNLAWSSAFLWAGGVEGTLEDVMRFEVASFFATDVSVLQGSARYPPMYQAAFGTPEITVDRTAAALAQFARTMVSIDSRYDAFRKGQVTLNAQEMSGMMIFFLQAGCGTCHPAPLFTDGRFRNNGLDAVHVGSGEGRHAVTGAPADLGLFKVPTLRNAEYTAPYMHDGRFATLEDVVEFYNSGIQASSTLDPALTHPGRENGLHLGAQDKAALLAFLRTLGDPSFLANPDLASPF